MANGINDTPVLMAAKSHLRNERNLVLGISTIPNLNIPSFEDFHTSKTCPLESVYLYLFPTERLQFISWAFINK